MEDREKDLRPIRDVEYYRAAVRRARVQMALLWAILAVVLAVLSWFFPMWR